MSLDFTNHYLLAFRNPVTHLLNVRLQCITEWKLRIHVAHRPLAAAEVVGILRELPNTRRSVVARGQIVEPAASNMDRAIDPQYIAVGPLPFLQFPTLLYVITLIYTAASNHASGTLVILTVWTRVVIFTWNLQTV